MKLKDRVVLVTGGSRGIGAACCKALAEKGCDVAVNFNASPERAEQVVAHVAGAGRRALAVRADVSVTSDVNAMVEQVRAEFGRIDILVNNAGAYFDDGKKLVEMTDEQWDRTMAVNLRSTFLCCRAVLGEMMQRREGKILIIGSCAGGAGQWTTVYCASKAAQQGLAMSLAREMTPFNVHVNLIAPGGAIDTDMHADSLPEEKAKWQDRLTADGRYPLEAGIAPPEDIAHAVIFAAKNDFLHGEVLKVSGGTCICP